MVFLLNDLNEIGANLGEGHGGDSLNEHYHSAAALALHLDKVTLGAVERSAMNAYFGAFLYVYLLGAKVGDAFILCASDSDELLHLCVWNNDWGVFAVFGAGVVL